MTGTIFFLQISEENGLVPPYLNPILLVKFSSVQSLFYPIPYLQPKLCEIPW